MKRTPLKRTLVTISAAMAVGAVVLAQAPAMPKPGPEHKALSYFAGKWTSEGEMKASPLGPAGKATSSDSCELFAGGFQVVCRGKGTTPVGPVASLGILGYNAAEKTYTYYGIDSTGMADLATGQKIDNTWTFTSTSNASGQTFKSRFTVVEVSPTVHTYKWEMSKDGTTWSSILEGKSTKTGKGT
jgi:hypothetical protein